MSLTDFASNILPAGFRIGPIQALGRELGKIGPICALKAPEQSLLSKRKRMQVDGSLSFAMTTTLVMPVLVAGVHRAKELRTSALKFGSAGQPSWLYPCKRIDPSLMPGWSPPNWAWTAMLWSRSSVGRRHVHIVSGSVEGQLISLRTVMGEVKERSSWKERMYQVYLIRVTRVKTKCPEYYLGIAVPWRLVSVECDEHLHWENSTLLIMLWVDANSLKPYKPCQQYHTI